MKRPSGVKASEYMSRRNELLAAIFEIDKRIDKTLENRLSKSAFEKAKELFAVRSRVAKELSAYGIDIEPHPSVMAHIKDEGV